ncbi:DUF4350 domain-containing protein [Muricauda sp. 334s03]|uniref:DUF4350 domain-containing protein n=1 Tax=Flagellimonas yonaguniensis TaxID=3031325 RepID=A0ABT5Y286_9FLAO|nr:DUF4350 domain-containing protein [[Muricauda] yonaguniensis]MDF0717563.1 DUF4350 domain-containing protein [[Muricauda] yonaguniensis]
MDKKSKIVIGIFALVVVGIIITEVVRPKPINWNPSYTATDKIPFGCHVLYNELPTIFPNNTIETVQESVYNVLLERDSSKLSNYLIINDGIHLDKQETHQILDYVNQGNTVFIAAAGLGWQLMDTLNIAISSDYSLKEGSAILSLTHKKFKDEKFTLSRGVFNSHFTSVDSTNTTILGNITYTRENYLEEQSSEQVTKPNFIRTDFGKGAFILSTTPQAYSNYYMLKGNSSYVTHSFGYLQNREVLYWDNYKKAGRVVIDSPMRFVLNQVSLKWAYYLTIIGLLLFVLFKGKREQRIIPVIEPLKNSSVEFAQAVGSLYHQNKDHTDLIHKKINYFLAYLRNQYHIETTKLNEQTIQILASRAGKDMTETKNLVEFILKLKNKNVHSEQESIELNKKITAFKQ